MSALSHRRVAAECPSWPLLTLATIHARGVRARSCGGLGLAGVLFWAPPRPGDGVIAVSRALAPHFLPQVSFRLKWRRVPRCAAALGSEIS